MVGSITQSNHFYADVWWVPTASTTAEVEKFLMDSSPRWAKSQGNYVRRNPTALL